MRQIWWAVILVLVAMAPALAGGAAEVEWRIKDIEWQIRNAGSRSYTTWYDKTHISVKYAVDGERRAFVQLDRNGGKLREWLRRPGGIVRYEAWYSPGHVKEQLLEDDRSVSYNSFYRSGQKREEYHYNKQKKLKAFYQYDKNGKLMKP